MNELQSMIINALLPPCSCSDKHQQSRNQYTFNRMTSPQSTLKNAHTNANQSVRHRRKPSLLVCARPELIYLCRVRHRCCVPLQSGLSGTRRAVGRSRLEGATGGEEAWERRRGRDEWQTARVGSGKLLLGDAAMQ